MFNDFEPAQRADGCQQATPFCYKILIRVTNVLTYSAGGSSTDSFNAAVGDS